jgi:hypothetical protein
MLTLVIQTVFPEPQILLMNSAGQLGESVNWKSDKDEIKKVIPEIETVLTEAGYGWKDVSRIVSVVGTGNFSSTRIGVTIANILAMATTADIFELRLDQPLESEELANLISGKFKKGWEKSALARPVYKTAPMISPSKKKIFNN